MDEKPRIVIIGQQPPNSWVKNVGFMLLDVAEVIILTANTFYKMMPEHAIEKYTVFRQEYSLKPIEAKYKPDLILIHQTALMFKNDVDCMVVYLHREILVGPCIKSPDLFMYAQPVWLDIFRQFIPTDFFKVPSLYLQNGYNEKIFPFIPWEEKTVDELSFIGHSCPIEEKYSWKANILFVSKIDDILALLEMYKKKVVVHNEGYSFQEYRKMLQERKRIFLYTMENHWDSRRIYEAMGSGTLLYLYVHSRHAKEFYEHIGLKNGKNCFFISSFEDIDKANAIFDYEPKEIQKIIKNAHDWAKKNTYKGVIMNMLTAIDRHTVQFGFKFDSVCHLCGKKVESGDNMAIFMEQYGDTCIKFHRDCHKKVEEQFK